MAGLAHIGRINMSTGQTVAARTATSAIDLAMIHSNHRRPLQWTMAGLTKIRGIDMPRRLTMTTCAGATTDQLIVIRRCRRPTRGTVTSLTHIG